MNQRHHQMIANPKKRYGFLWNLSNQCAISRIQISLLLLFLSNHSRWQSGRPPWSFLVSLMVQTTQGRPSRGSFEMRCLWKEAAMSRLNWRLQCEWTNRDCSSMLNLGLKKALIEEPYPQLMEADSIVYFQRFECRRAKKWPVNLVNLWNPVWQLIWRRVSTNSGIGARWNRG